MHRHRRRSRWTRRRRWRWGRRSRVHRCGCRRRRMESRRRWRCRRWWCRMHRGRRRCRREGVARRRRRWWRRLYRAWLRLTARRRQRSRFHRCRPRSVLWWRRRTRFHEGIRRRWRWRRRPARSGTRRRRKRRQGRGAGARCRTESRSRRRPGWRRVRHRGRQRDALLPAFGSCAGRSRRRAAEFDTARRPHESGHGGAGGNRQREAFALRRWRRQHRKLARPWRQEEQRRPRWWRVARSGKYDDRLVDIAEFVRRRRRHAEIVIGEIGRRVVGRGQHRQAPPRIPDMGSVRIAAQI